MARLKWFNVSGLCTKGFCISNLIEGDHTRSKEGAEKAQKWGKHQNHITNHVSYNVIVIQSFFPSTRCSYWLGNLIAIFPLCCCWYITVKNKKAGTNVCQKHVKLLFVTACHLYFQWTWPPPMGICENIHKLSQPNELNLCYICPSLHRKRLLLVGLKMQRESNYF